MRRIVSQRLQAAGGNAKPDDYFDRIVKYVPADIVAAWIAVSALLANKPNGTTIFWIAFGAMAVIALLWTLKQTRVAGQPPAYLQAAIATAAFVVWAIATANAPSPIAAWDSTYRSLVLIFFTLIVGLVVP